MNDWRHRAACAETQVDPELFFPDGPKDGTVAAKAVCARCPVRGPCLEFALKHDVEYGVFGGVGARGRRRLRVLVT